MAVNDTSHSYAILSDTFDQWRMKTNGLVSMTNASGSSNFIKLTNTTNSTSNTTGSIVTAGGMGIAASAVVGGNLTVFGDLDEDGTTNLDVVDIDGAVQIDGTVTVGEDDTGHDVKFFGAASASPKIVKFSPTTALAPIPIPPAVLIEPVVLLVELVVFVNLMKLEEPAELVIDNHSLVFIRH